MSEFSNKLTEIEESKAKLEIEKSLAIKSALTSTDPEAIFKAQTYLNAQVAQRTKSNSKSFVFDPLSAFDGNFGYKEKPLRITSQLLRAMGRSPIPAAIKGTRVEQIADFSEPQANKYSPGFIIRRKQYGQGDGKPVKPSRNDQKTINWLTDFILNGGEAANAWHGDSFDTFIRKIVPDSMDLDAACFEVVRDRRGMPSEFFAVDAATIRLAESFDDDNFDNKRNAANIKTKINGYFPSFVQVYNQEIYAEFYPWELCYGIRNPRTDISVNGYGQSELELLINTITSMLNADAYNANFFKIGSHPKGFLKVSKDFNESRLQEFRQQWQAQMMGVNNAHRIGVLEAEKMDWISTHVGNADMEFGKFQEYLVRLACAIYKIAPEEIGFESGSGDKSAMFEGNKAEKLQYSKDKGLKPLLKFIQSFINKYLINPLAPEFEFVYVGLDADTEEKELELLIKKQSYMTLKETREAAGLEGDIDPDDIILNTVWAQLQAQKQMGNQQSNDVVDGMDKFDPSDLDNPDKKDGNGDSNDNPMLKSFNSWMEKEFEDGK